MRRQFFSKNVMLVAVAIVFFLIAGQSLTLAATPNFEKRTLTLAGYYSPGNLEDPMYRACQHFAKLVNDYTNGKVTVDISGEGQIYSSGAEMVKAAMMGSLDIVWVPQSRHTACGLKNWKIFSVPGLLTAGGGGESYYGKRLYAFFNDPKVHALFSKEAQSKGLKLFTVVADQPLQLIAREPYQPDDLKGLQLGCPGALGYRLIAERYQFSSVPLVATGERYSAIKQGMIYGILGTSKHLSLTYKWVDLIPYAMSEPWSTIIHTLEISSMKWESYGGDLKKLLEEKVIPEATEFARKAYAESVENIDQKYLAAGGKNYSWSEKDVMALRAWYPTAAEKFRDELKDAQLLDLGLSYQ